MTHQEILNVLDVLERKYKVEGYHGPMERAYNEGKLAALADVRHYAKMIDDINRNGIA
jgi:hypothetical protein